MDTILVAVTIVLAFVVVVVGFFVYRQSTTTGIKIGPFSFDFRGSNTPPAPLPGARVRGSRSQHGAIRATDTTGSGSEVLGSTAHGDIEATAHSAEAPADPKARPLRPPRSRQRPSR